MARPRPMKGMGIIADPHRKVIKKRGGKKPAKPGWGQALLGRSRRGWSLGGALNSKRKGYQQGRALSPRAVKKAWGYNRPYDPRDLTRQLASPHQVGNVNAAIQAGKVQHFGPSSGGSVKRPPGGWSVGGALNPKKNKKKTGYQGGGRTGFAASTITAPKDQYGRTYGFKRRHLGKSFDPRVSSKAVQYARSQPPRGWDRGGPAKFRDDQSLGIRGGKVRKPVGYNSGGILEKVPVKKKKKVHPASVGGRGKRVRIKPAPSKRSKAKQKYLSKGRGG